MLRDDYECLGMAANMTTLIELTSFLTCDVLLATIEMRCVYYCFGMSETFSNSCMSMILFIRNHNFFFYFERNHEFSSYSKHGTHTFLTTA